MRRVVITKLAASDIQRILRRSEVEFGVAARSRYRELLDRAIRDVAEHPAHPGVRAIDDVRAGYRLYHLRYSRTAVAGLRVGRPRHLLAFYLPDDERLVVAAVVHERELIERHLAP